VGAGHKGPPEVVKSQGRKGRRRRRQGQVGRGTLAQEKPPVCGMMERGGQVVMPLLAKVTQQTIAPCLKDPLASGTLGYTEECGMYARLETWGSDHTRGNQGRGEYARDEEGDGVGAVHVNSMAGFGSLRRRWLRAHRGIAQEQLPLSGVLRVCAQRPQARQSVVGGAYGMARLLRPRNPIRVSLETKPL
jgi:transposase-like protein